MTSPNKFSFSHLCQLPKHWGMCYNQRNKNQQKMTTILTRYFFGIISLLFSCVPIGIYGFSASTFTQHDATVNFRSTTSRLFLRTNVEVPLLDLLDVDTEYAKNMVFPLPSSHFPSELATPFLYGMQLERPIDKMLLEEASANKLDNDEGRPVYGHLVWKDNNSDSLVGAIGCTGEILVNAPTEEVLNDEIARDLQVSNQETTLNTVLCRGGWRFVIKEVVKSIPYPIVLIDEIVDDADDDDSAMFSMVSSGADTTDDDDDEDDDFEDPYIDMPPEELIRRVMFNVQGIVSQKMEDANSKEISILEQSIMEDGGMFVDPTSIEQYQAEEMAAVWDVFQSSLIDEIEPKDRRFSIAVMAAELAEFNNDIRQKILLTRDALERLRIVAKELDDTVGMARARKLATKITDKSDDSDRDLKVGVPQLPPWAQTIVKGTRIEYYWNEEYDWVAGEVIEDPVKIVDEILLTIRFDDGEVHQLPLNGDDKARWRPE